MFYDKDEICVCKCGYKDVAKNLDMDVHLLCVRCPKCNELMSVDESSDQQIRNEK